MDDPLGTILIGGGNGDSVDSAITVSAPGMPYIRPAARANRATSQSIPFNTLTAVSFTAEEFDTNGIFTPTSTNFVIQTKGLYYFSGGVQWQHNNTNGANTWHEVHIVKNGVSVAYDGFNQGINPIAMTVNWFGKAEVGDIFTLGALQGSNVGSDSVNIDPTLVGTPFSGSPSPSPIHLECIRLGNF
jgi:hypothetical protein